MQKIPSTKEGITRVTGGPWSDGTEGGKEGEGGKETFAGGRAGRRVGIEGNTKGRRRIKKCQKPVRGLSSRPASSAPPVFPPQQAGNDKI